MKQGKGYRSLYLPAWSIVAAVLALPCGTTLDETGGNRTRAAEILGINRRTLQNKLKDYWINA